MFDLRKLADPVLGDRQARERTIPGLDGLRTIAVMMVLVLHGTYQKLPGLFLGVDLFFAISGFLITGILLTEAQDRGLSLSRFYLKRIARLVPALILAYLLASVLFLALAIPAPTPLGTVAIFGFFANLVEGKELGSLSVTWSLAVEEHFYLLWPLAVMLTIRTGSARALAMIAVAAVMLSIVARPLALLADMDREAIYRQTIFRLDGLGMGALAGIAWQRRPALVERGVRWMERYRAPFVLIAATVPALILMSTKSTFTQTIGLPLASAAATCTVIYAACGGRMFRSILNNRLTDWIGARSYGIYIFHLPIFRALEPLRETGNQVNLVLVLSLKIGVAMAAAAASYPLERRVSAWARSWRRPLAALEPV